MSIETQNQVQLGTALQVFRSLGQLQSKVDAIIDSNTQAVLKAIAGVLNDAAFKDGDHSASLAARRATLWTKMEKVMDALFNITVQVRHLERVLSKKRDHNTQSSYLEELRNGEDFARVERFWSDVMAQLGAEFGKLSAKSPFIE